MDAIVYGLAVSLGFSARENIDYILNYEYYQVSAEYMAGIRLIPTIMHATSSMIMALFLSKAIFTNQSVQVRLILALLNGYLHDAMTLSIGSGIPKHTAIGIGMWLGIVMAFNVWFVIWPNQKRALGIVEVDPEIKAKSAKTAMLFSRTNTLLSLPMLLSMVAAQNLY